MSRDATVLDGVGHSGTLTFWDTAGRRPTIVRQACQGQVMALALGPDGRRLAVAGSNGTIRVWDLASGDPLVLARHRGRVSGIVLSDWGRVLLSAGSDGMVRVWDVSTDVPQIVQRHSRAGVRVLLSADGATVASLARDSPDLRVSSGSSHAHLLIPYRHGLADIAFGPRPGEITGAQVDGAVRVWSWRTDRLRTMPATGFTCGAPSH